VKKVDYRVQGATRSELLKSDPAGEIAAEHLGRRTDDLDGDAVPGVAQFLQPFFAAKRQPSMEVVEVLGFVSSVADVVVECFVALDPVGHRVELGLERCEQILGLQANLPPLPAPWGIFGEVGNPGLICGRVHCSLWALAWRKK